MSKHEFLSEEWIAAAQAIREDYAGTSTTSPPPMKMNVVITEVPFDESTMDAHIDTTDGEMTLDMGHLDSADLTVTVDYATAKAIFIDQDQQASMQAFMAGKIKVQGDMTKMMAMQTVQPDPAQVEMATKIAEMTA
ncbi:SCP2 sterol-binding domain-containing protein [Acidimicrobiia bacterium EGI L10123]|uniref:SCP2 sterol-binding domain-containing protein n=1 Tax=Salinilacustrithrix flava TaxID=2957203 RepID=UPI003D7C326A|nr:SCP2 sterol-binding domain-containing protein [Acidimicrobiia bacterium EGI L10123]